MATSPTLTWREFGTALFETNDLDPVYVALYELLAGGLDRDAVKRWLVAYWMFYHCGFACEAAERSGPGFWAHLADGFDGHPRGAERRHFREAAALSALKRIEAAHGSPERLVSALVSGGRVLTLDEVSRRVKTLPMFGPWISWKVCDMLERIMGAPIRFDPRALGMYRDPVQGAALILKGHWTAEITVPEVAGVASSIVDVYRGVKAPPRYERPVNVQEAETVLCKFKSYWKGHYYVGKDIADIRHGLAAFAERSDFARAFLDVMPLEV